MAILFEKKTNHFLFFSFIILSRAFSSFTPFYLEIFPLSHRIIWCIFLLHLVFTCSLKYSVEFPVLLTYPNLCHLLFLKLFLKASIHNSEYEFCHASFNSMFNTHSFSLVPCRSTGTMHWYDKCFLHLSKFPLTVTFLIYQFTE